MIESKKLMNFLYNKSDHVAYAVVLFIAFISASVGYMLAYQEPKAICAEYIVDGERQREINSELNQKLTKCESNKAGKAVLDCQSICDDRVQEALKTYKDIVCDD